MVFVNLLIDGFISNECSLKRPKANVRGYETKTDQVELLRRLVWVWVCLVSGYEL